MMNKAFNSITQNLRVFWANPVVVRDLRVRMRGSKTYWNQAFYLIILSLVALAGYATTVGRESSPDGSYSIVDLQYQLAGFYYYIFVTLATLLCFIAPALTAAAITSERQRLTLDLLVTTPLTFTQLLVGKLLSSVAFLLLLLALSLPGSVLCILLGGATLGQVFQTYLLLALDSLLLATLGIYYSCSMQKSNSALAWTYGATVLFVIVTAVLGSFATFGGYSSGTGSPMLILGSLNPFLAIFVGSATFEVAGKSIPLWVGTVLYAFFLIRLLLTAASYRMGNFGGNPIASLRRQLLLVIAITLSLAFWGSSGASVWGAGGFAVASGIRSSTSAFTFVLSSLVWFFFCCMPFLPSLFTPTYNEENAENQVFSSYRIRKAFSTDHSGALPYFHLLFATVTLVVLGARYYSAGFPSLTDWGQIAVALYYISALGFLFWAIARRASGWFRAASGARSVAFGAYILLSVAPFVFVDYSTTSAPPAEEAFYLKFWLFYPSIQRTDSKMLSSCLIAGTILYLLGTLIYPFWWKVKQKRA